MFAVASEKVYVTEIFQEENMSNPKINGEIRRVRLSKVAAWQST